MSRAQTDAIKKLCLDKETFTKAQSLLRKAAAKTGPGSGYNLGEDSAGLPAICAYVASLELGNGDVSEKVAQTASCIKPKRFKNAVQTVRTALAAVSEQECEREQEWKLTYESLITKFKIGRPVFVRSCLDDVEKALVASRLLPQDLHPPCDVTTIAIFCWTCETVMKMKSKNIRPEPLLQKHGFARADYDDVLDILQTACQSAVKTINAKVDGLKKHVAAPADPTATASASTTTPTPMIAPTPAVSPFKPPAASPTKAQLHLRSLTRSPSKSALRARDPSASPTKTPTHKRKVAFHDLGDADELDLLETPTKRRRISVMKPPHPSALPPPARSRSSTKRPFPTVSVSASSSDTLDLLRNAEDGADAGPSLPRTPSHSRIAGPGAPVAGPSTPRRRASAPQTPMSARRASTSGAETPSRTRRLEDDAPHRPRFRPVFADQRQWCARDTHSEREWRLVEEFRRSLVVGA